MSPKPSLPPLTVSPVLGLAAASEHEAILATTALLKGQPLITDFSAYVDAVLERQKINPPLLGNGIALPHARTPVVKEIVFAAARLAAPVSFGHEEKPVQLVFLFGVPPQRISEYLAATAALVRRLCEPGTVAGLLEAPDEAAFLERLGCPLLS